MTDEYRADEYVGVHGSRPWSGDTEGHEPSYAPQKASYCKPEICDICLNCTKPTCSGNECQAYREAKDKASTRKQKRKPVVVKAIAADRHYSPGRPSNKYYVAGVGHTIAEWAEITGVKIKTLQYRIRKGIPIEEAIEKEDRRHYNKKGRKVRTMKAKTEAEAVAVEVAHEAVDHPAHYNAGKLEVIDAIEGLGMGRDFNRGNAIKYLARAGLKSKATEIEDLEKAVWYIRREIERLKKGAATNGEG